jgi:hypothetical protein
MKQINLEIQKWLISYVIISLFLVVYLWDFNFRRRETLELILVTHLWVTLVFLIKTFFFYFKITKKSIWWCIIRTLFCFTLGFFLAPIFTFLLLSVWEEGRRYLVEYFIYGGIIIVLNGLFMLRGAHLEQNRITDSDILDHI